MTGKELKDKIRRAAIHHVIEPEEYNNLFVKVFAGVFAYVILTDGTSDIHTIELYGNQYPKTW